MISLDDGKKLVKLARHSIETYFSGKMISMPDEFSEKRGVFVTLNEFGKLRGCIGYTEPIYTLKRAIVEAARAAAFKDPRFPTVTEDELDDITIEISVLTKPELLEKSEEYLDKIEVGKHGLIIRSAFHSGLLLPQVFTEYNSTPKQALEMTCQKAGLPTDAWKNLDNKIYIFSAQIFKEEEPYGEITKS